MLKGFTYCMNQETYLKVFFEDSAALWITMLPKQQSAASVWAKITGMDPP